MTMPRFCALTLSSLFILIVPARAQEPVAAGAPAGYELALTGATQAERGHPLRLAGVAYEVEGLASMRAGAGLVIDAAITARRGSGSERRTVQTGSVTADTEGRFTVALAMPDELLSAPQLELTVHRRGQPGRRFTFGLGQRRAEAVDLLLDRVRYEPGERVRVWTRVRSVRTHAPLAGQPVFLELLDRSGQPLAEEQGETGASGVVSAELPVPESAEAGDYRVRARVGSSLFASRSIQVWRRTVERLLGEVELRGQDEDGLALVVPGAPLRGTVWARTPSGTPVGGANVELRVRHDAEPVRLTTEADGGARFEVPAPAYLSGDVGRETLTARIVHAAHGTADASAAYLMARVRAVVEVTPRGGALVPELPGTLLVAVRDPRGRPLPEGTPVVVRGAGMEGRSVTLDSHGLADVSIVLPRGAASTLRTGPCAGRVATTVEVEVQTDPPVVTRVCAMVSAHAQVAPRLVGAPVRAPGETIEVEVARRSAARSRPVLVEALWDGRAIASAWVGPRANRAELRIPDDLLGVVTLRARAARAADSTEPPSEPGASAFTVGAFDALLLRPADAFSIEVRPERERYLIRERAQVTVAASGRPAQNGWAALLVRDQAAHGGEGPWDLHFLREELREAATAPRSDANARLVRVALSSGLGIDPEPPRPPPLEAPYWWPQRAHRSYSTGQTAPGVLRDPVASREELLRRGLQPVEAALEQAVRGLGRDPAARAPIVRGRGFHPDVVAHLVDAGRLSRAHARTLGGEPLTVAMIERADPGFSFDTVARRVARARLAKLLLALSRLVDPDDPNAQRASAALPPERWLGALVQLGMVPAHELTDPWGRAYVFRRVPGRPKVAVSERALEWELASPGPDGRIGTADDVNDPFARAVPEGTPYAVTSGEDALLRHFGALAPAQLVLTRMSQAYDRVALAATEERRGGAVTASSSEAADEMLANARERAQGESFDRDQAGFGGVAGGGAAGSAPPARRSVRRSRAPAPSPEPPAQESEAPPASAADALAAIVREDFPATLFFAGEVPLDGAGAATIEVPLADALTTYRLEAIAWTSSGWTTSGANILRVDQTALVDAPVPPFATVGDRLRVPVRVENRTDAPLPVRVAVQAEGLDLEAPAPTVIEVPAREARETVVVVALRSPGEGALVVSVASPEGEGLDAVRRPMRVLEDARTARERRLVLVEGTHRLTVEVPAVASARGPGLLRLSVGARLFGGPEESVGHPLWAGWALAMAGEGLSDALALPVLAQITYEDADAEYLREPLPSALALAAAWRDPRLTDGDARRALRAVGQHLPAPEHARAEASVVEDVDWLLLALAPIAGQLDHRPAVRADAERLLARLRRLVSNGAASAVDAPVVWARAAAGLAWTGETERAAEMVRRSERSWIQVGEQAWLEPGERHQVRSGDRRAQPTALLALAMSGLDRRADAMALVRGLLAMRPAGVAAAPDRILPPDFLGIDRALASAAAARLGAGPTKNARVTLDGQVIDTTQEGGVLLASLPGLGRPGRHTLEIAVAEGAVALAQLSLAYGLPWDVAPRRQAPIALRLDGEVGPRDARSGLLLHVQSRGPRILTRPVVEIELPAGAELDEPTRAALAAHLRADPRQEGRTLILPLRRLVPGGWVRLPLPVRWAVSGTLRGLGAVAYDEASASHSSAAVAILPSRAVEIADEGPAPAPPNAERAPSMPPPIPLLERLVPGGA